MSLTTLYLRKGLVVLQTQVIKAVLHIHFSATVPGHQSQHTTDAVIAAGIEEYVYSFAKVKFITETMCLFHRIANTVQKTNITNSSLVWSVFTQMLIVKNHLLGLSISVFLVPSLNTFKIL